MKQKPSSIQSFSSIQSSALAFKRALAVGRQILAEIFEEAAYARFLERHGIQSSREAYAHYLRESATARARRSRCC
jgi:hypothetical protein